jgi:transposase
MIEILCTFTQILGKIGMQKLSLTLNDVVSHRIRQYFSHNEEALFIHRLDILLALTQRPQESCESIASLFGTSPRSVSNWIKRLNATNDIESLRTKHRSGRPARLSAAQKAELKQTLQSPPDKAGMSANGWNGKVLSAYIAQCYGVTLKVRQCQKLFHALGMSLRRARPMPVKGNAVTKQAWKAGLKKS